MTLSTIVGISLRPRVVLPIHRIVLWISITIIRRKLTKCTAVKGELKGISPTVAILVRRLRIKISLFLVILAERLIRGSYGSVNRGL
jgi:hypothetical protein